MDTTSAILMMMNAVITLPELVGERCRLRGWRSEDAIALRPACGDPEICRFTTVPHRFVLEDVRAWIARQNVQAREGTAVVLAIIPNPGETPVGMAGLFGLADAGCAARFGYWLNADQRGWGLASAASALLADWGFRDLGLSQIHIDREPGNHASARVAEKLGAVRSGSRWVEQDGSRIQLIRHTMSAPTSEEH